MLATISGIQPPSEPLALSHDKHLDCEAKKVGAQTRQKGPVVPVAHCVEMSTPPTQLEATGQRSIAIRAAERERRQAEREGGMENGDEKSFLVTLFHSLVKRYQASIS